MTKWYHYIPYFFLGFLINPMLWMAIYHLLNYKK